jgi:hypothetical protein
MKELMCVGIVFAVLTMIIGNYVIVNGVVTAYKSVNND